MRLGKIRYKRAERPNWALPFFAGFMAGIVAAYFQMDALSESGGFMGLSALDRLRFMELNTGQFFFYVLKKRFGTLWFLAVFATTFAGIILSYLYMFWLGAGGGMLLGAFILRFGVKGIFLMGAGMMPHFLCYIPACLMLVNWCFLVCSRLYYPTRVESYQRLGRLTAKKHGMAGILLGLFWIHGVVIIGALLESYVNPNIVTKLLHVF